MPTTTATRVTLAAAAGLLALTACSAGGAAAPSTAASTSSPASASSSPAPSGTTSSAPPGSALASAPVGTEERPIRSLTQDGKPVEVPSGATLAVSPGQPAFLTAVSGICGQPRWGVAVVDAGHWSATDDVPQPAEGCSSDAPGQAARSALTSLFDGTVEVKTDDDGTLTLTGGGAKAVLAPAG